VNIDHIAEYEKECQGGRERERIKQKISEEEMRKENTLSEKA